MGGDVRPGGVTLRGTTEGELVGASLGARTLRSPPRTSVRRRVGGGDRRPHSGDIYYWGSLMAGAVLASVPIVIVYVLFLDYYVSGLTAGAVKG
jgi:hypothetical protein